MDCACELCNYTGSKGNYLAHLKSLKHIKNQENADKLEQQQILDDKNSQIQELIDQAKINTDECVKLQSNLILKDIETKFLVDKIIQLETQIKLLTDHKNDIKTSADMVANVAGNVAGNVAVSTLNYITSNYTPPAIQTYKLNEYHNVMKTLDIIDADDDPKFVKNIVYHFSKNLLAKFLGDIIVKLYKKDDIKEQSMFNSDVSRLSYIIREKNGKKYSWTQDKTGILVGEYVIQPYLDYIVDLLKKAMVKLNEINTGIKMSVDKICKNNDTIKCYLEIKHSIDNKVLEREINKYIAPFFYFNQKEKIGLIKM